MSQRIRDLPGLLRAAEQCKTEPSTELRLRRQMQLYSKLHALGGRVAQDEQPAENDSQKARLLAARLKVHPPPVDSATPEALRGIAARLEGEIWSCELLASLDAQFQEFRKDASAVGTGIQESEAKQEDLMRRVRLLTAYADLLDNLAGSKTGQETNV